jgi:hypothetical protein
MIRRASIAAGARPVARKDPAGAATGMAQKVFGLPK